MRRILTVMVMVFSLPLAVMAGQADLMKSKGTGQPVIVSLIPAPGQDNVSKNTAIEAVFSIALDTWHVRDNKVHLQCISCKKKKRLHGKVSYDASEKRVSFIPNEPLEPGIYEIAYQNLKTTKANKKTEIKKIKYRFKVLNEVLQTITITPDPIELKEGGSLQLHAAGHYDTGAEKEITAEVQWSTADGQLATIDANATLRALKEGTTTITAKLGNVESSTEVTVYWEVNGHRLPPEPDKALNDSTLLGIDVNHNGVRDDVERWIYETYKDKHPIHIDIAMQGARGFKKILEEYSSAKEIHYHVTAYIDCESYYKNYANYFNDSILVEKEISTDYFRKTIYFNTQKRQDRYDEYSKQLSGGIYTLPKIEQRKALCDFNTSKYED